MISGIYLIVNCVNNKFSEEHKSKISAAHKGKKKTAEHLANILAGRKAYFAKLNGNKNANV